MPGGGNASRQYFALAGTTAINDWAARTKSRYHGLQVAMNRPFKNGLLLKGAYTYSKSKNMADEDGWVGLTWNSPLMYDRNFALAGFDRPHVFQMGFVYDAAVHGDWRRASARDSRRGWQINGIVAAYSGTPFSISGTNTALNCPGCGSIIINSAATPSRPAASGSNGQPYYPLANFSQPTAADVGGLRQHAAATTSAGRAVWNVDLSLFKAFPIGRVAARSSGSRWPTCSTTPNWGAPGT